MFNNDIIYKKAKKYENLQNHWVSGKIVRLRRNYLKEGFAIVKYKNNSDLDNNSFSIFNTQIKFETLDDRNLINYDLELERLLSKNSLNLFFENNSKISLGLFENNKYLKNNFFDIKNRGYILFFYKLDKKNIYFFFKEKKLKLLNDISLNNLLYDLNYKQGLIRELYLKSLKKQNTIFLLHEKYKQENIYIKTIFLGIKWYNSNKKNMWNIKYYVFYIPLLSKIYFIKSKGFRKKRLLFKIKKQKKIRKINENKYFKNLIKINFDNYYKKKIENRLLFIKYNIILKINKKYFSNFFFAK